MNKMGFVLLSDSYCLNTTPLKLKCSRGHVFYRTLSYFSQYKTCRECEEGKRKNKQGVLFFNAIKNGGFASSFVPSDYGKRYPQRVKEQKMRDLLKDKLCKEKGIYLIRIPYFIENKEKYIEKELTKLNINVIV